MAEKRSFGGIAFLVVILVACGVLGVFVQARLHARPRTDDAYLAADIVHMAPDISGRIVDLRVRDNQQVKRGDVLFTIDPEPYRYQVQAAQAQVDSLTAQIAVQTNQVSSQISHAGAEASSVQSARAQLALARSSEARLEPLARQGFVTMQALDQAQTAVRSAEATLQSALGAKQAVRSVAPLEANLMAARANFLTAQRDLRLTEVRAPCDGKVTDLTVAAGEYATVGHPVFTLIDTERWWAVANFRETQLPMLAVGQHVIVYAMVQPGQPIDGVIDSLNAGVVPDEGASFGGLPQVPRSLNWVRIAQRFPVRVLLSRPPAPLMRIGGTVVVVVKR